ncbi:unnamed protein product [Medioppia subpectinata]|uniref:Homeobox domain-containing protein n=1 Tax=Medioppia subpectinata TaxID=1979941 RepID=A0A7R9KFE3_9ACAR|nr:unnamed protein product [Medioppia subpectinata]CAG2102183.1 unnamed protein product [Medioppia subpectinata]
MTSNSNNSTADSPCCSSTGGTDTLINDFQLKQELPSERDNKQLASVAISVIIGLVTWVQSTTPLSPSTSSVCALTTPYDSRLISGHYPRLGSFYGSSYTEQNSFYTSGTNPFYSSFGNPYDLKDPNGNPGWGTLPQTTCYLYDPIYSPYSERYGAMDGVSRRKNVTRDSTTTLKAWLSEHRKNPYPTKGEKIMLAIITKMTLTQVSTWFANARRRLKKENKMTWEPRNRCDDNDDDDILSSDEDNDNSKVETTLPDGQHSQHTANHSNNSSLSESRVCKDLHISRQYMDPIKVLRTLKRFICLKPPIVRSMTGSYGKAISRLC